MNYGRGFPLPQYGNNRDSWIPASDNGNGPNSRDSYLAAMLGGPIPGSMGVGVGVSETPKRQIPVDEGIIYGKELESWISTPVKSTPMRHGIVGHHHIHQENWNQVMPTNPSPQGNGNASGCWTPVTQGKPITQISNLVAVEKKPTNEVEKENWVDLLGMYKGLLQTETLDLNEVAPDLYSPSTGQNNGSQNRVDTNLNPFLNSSPVPNQVLNPPVSCFPSEDPANWDGSLLAAIVRPKKSSTNVVNMGGTTTPVPKPSTQVANQQSPTFTSNKPTEVYNSNQLPTDGFPIPYRPCYNLNSPPRSDQDASSSGVTGPLQFAPITPDTQGKQQMEGQWVSANTSQRNEDGDGDNHYNDTLQNVGESTSTAVSKTQKEHLVSEEGDELGIDLNKTPQQKTPARRKKHRPKVIREGKAKKTPTPKDPKNTPLGETPIKRKYVRKKGVETSPNEVRVKRKYVRKKGVETPTQAAEDATAPDLETPPKSKKKLNFDLECVAGDESQSQTRVGQQGGGINLNMNPQDVEQERRINNVLERSAMNVAQNNMYNGVTTHYESSVNYMQNDTQHVPTTPMVKARDHALNVLARNLSMRNSSSGQGNNIENNIARNGYNQMGHGQHMVNFDERRGVKRTSIEQINPRNLNAMDSIYMYQKLLLGSDRSSYELATILETNKKTKMQMQTQNQAFLSTAPPQDNPRQTNGVYGNVSALQLLNSRTGRVNASYQINGRQFQPHIAAAAATTNTQNLHKYPVSSEMQSMMDRSQRTTQGHGANPVTAMISWNRPPATPAKDNYRSAVVPYAAALEDKRRTATPNSTNQRSNGNDKMILQFGKDSMQAHQQPLPKPRGAPRKQKVVVAISVEDVTSMLEGLCIYDENVKGRNALVPYKGNNNAIIPFEPIKKRKPRPKVDLDPETDRLWRLLMGKEGSEANETLDKDKEIWWENERRVFRGRADSFIARMHLVQGDRRFSRWKGSVVDSVIGVFLTQNVSDHLSSSAFMSLAAKFSFKSTNTKETRCQDRACVVVEEPIDTILPNDKIERPLVFNQSSTGSCESSEHTRDNHVSSTIPAENKRNGTSEEVILSQDSLDSSTIQTVDEIRSSSGSNSEAEDQTIGFETSKDPGLQNSTQQPEKVNMFTELFSSESLNNPQNNGSHYMHHLPKTPSSNAGSSGLGTTETFHTSNANYQQNEIPRFRIPPQSHYDFLGNHQENLQTRSHVGSVQHSTSTKADNGAHKQDSCSEDRVSTVGKQNFENAAAEASSKERPLNGANANTPKGRKAAEEERQRSLDWDSLRRDVFMKREKQERSQDAKDSLDYEALRRAHVNEISDAIRERGMNNLLADRIKDFLDRLVRDHGSIDLEWLRDAPPDKAKDYLLSIRGLGLKSVECVRLLTLHHLAFPVDTNVGRIAVRLGWVPLQPLPESLQLHLLEMYPVLESIQKYLWPRLCKLDQLTLYELHYQMITFGKVFCTKSKPNCNACPMRAECRHFASAFASARLALPGPEEKRMVPSDAQNSQNGQNAVPPVMNRPKSLPPSENNDFNKDAGSFRRQHEPIIEEPSTPEPETVELSLSDIEDQYYDDDADEIPTIKLDMEEFTINLQKMQDSMEIQGDMSKALVALNPQAASIPTPKLKNVSRLRTEHLVYELPDSHPILEGLDKREPDDPSHYLLAIWTPGETANSMQPPERGCRAQESGILCESTTCFSCNCIKEANSQVVRGTILVPCRTAMRGSFPLNGTYFQVNEMFADHASSLKPIDVPRSWIWNLPRRTVYFGTSVSTIFKGLTTQEIQQCFWRGFVCVRGFDQKSRAPRPLMARLHFPASKLVKTKNEEK